jgi:hypothetical protein
VTYEAHEGYRLSCECEICCAKRAQEPDHFAKYHPRSAAELFRAIDAEMTARTIDAPTGPIVEFTAEEDSLTPHLP